MSNDHFKRAIEKGKDYYGLEWLELLKKGVGGMTFAEKLLMAIIQENPLKSSRYGPSRTPEEQRAHDYERLSAATQALFGYKFSTNISDEDAVAYMATWHDLDKKDVKRGRTPRCRSDVELAERATKKNDFASAEIYARAIERRVEIFRDRRIGLLAGLDESYTDAEVAHRIALDEIEKIGEQLGLKLLADWR